MTIEEAIKYLDEMLKSKSHIWESVECRDKHEQIRNWLVELKSLKEVPNSEYDRFDIKPIVFKQQEEPWGHKVYSNHGDKRQTMARSGSGPTLAADVVATCKDRSVNPWTLAELSLVWGCRTYMSGTCWSFFKKVAEHYGFRKFIESSYYTNLVACLDAGGYVICSMRGGYWTHGVNTINYILVWKHDSEYVYGVFADRSNPGHQRIDDFKRDCRRYFCFFP